MNNVSHLYFVAELRQMMSHNIVKNISKNLKNRLIISKILYILNIGVNVCRLLMVRDINNSVRKCSPSVNADGEFYHNRKVAYGDTTGIFLSYQG